MIYCYDMLKRYSYTQIGLDILDVSVLSFWVMLFMQKNKRNHQKLALADQKQI